jgi:hypothetical protein
MYANTGIATDSARVTRANRTARWLAKPLCKLFKAQPMPDLQMPTGAKRAPVMEPVPVPVPVASAD